MRHANLEDSTRVRQTTPRGNGGTTGWATAILASLIGAASLRPASATDAEPSVPAGDPAEPSPGLPGTPQDHASHAAMLANEHSANAVQTAPAGTPAPDHATSEGWDFGIAGEGSFRFDDDQVPGAAHPVTHSTNSAAADITPQPFDVSTFANAAHAGTEFVVTTTPPAGSGNAGTSPGSAEAAADAGNSLPVFILTTPHESASVAKLHTPVLAWLGDIGNGATHAGGAVGSTGNVAVNDARSSSGLDIHVIYDSSVRDAPAGFKKTIAEVVSFYERHFSDPVTVTIRVGYGEIDGQALDSSALGESQAYLTSASYAKVRAALAQNARAVGDRAAAANLPSEKPDGGRYWVTTAEAKALGLSGASGGIDGFAGFNDTANLFAYNHTTRVGANRYDFFGTVAHEFSEVMGRQVMVGQQFAGSRGFEPLDLFHYAAAGELAFAGTTRGYASADGGETSLDHFNTNPNGDFGDWARSAGNDSYLAFSSPGVVNPVTDSDLTVMNLLGWDSASGRSRSSFMSADARGVFPLSLSSSHAEAGDGGVHAVISHAGHGHPLDVVAVEGAAANVGHAVEGEYGTLTLNADGGYSYDHIHTAAVKAAGGVIEDTFSYSVSGAHGGTRNAELTVIVTGPGKTYVTGERGDTVHGGANAEVVDGSAGGMTAKAGGGGAHWLIGGAGDTLIGGVGADTFMFAPNFGHETIRHFDTAHDVIDLPKNLVADFAALRADLHASGADSVIAIDPHDAITLSHVAVHDLHAHNFHFVL